MINKYLPQDISVELQEVLKGHRHVLSHTRPIS